ncbi:hypothetical protein AAC387_Pa03g4039 [Persea americana]
MSESMQNRASEMLSRNSFYLNNPPPSRLMVNSAFCHFAFKFEELLSAFHIFSWTLHMIRIQEVLDKLLISRVCIRLWQFIGSQWSQATHAHVPYQLSHQHLSRHLDDCNYR